MLVNLKSLIGRLNPTARTVLESAAGLCLSRTHYDIEVEHFLVKSLDFPDSDFDRIARYFGVDKVRLSAELARSLDRLKTGNARTPSFDSQMIDALIKGWTYGSLELGSTVIRTGFVAFALIADDELSRLVFEFSKEMHKIERESLRRNFSQIVAGSAEDSPVAAGSSASTVPKVSGGPHIFISYRREDSASYADFLFVCLKAEVPDVYIFHDTDTLQPGMVFSEKIEETVAACDVLLALIGKKWPGAKRGGAPRIHREDDWVRLEIAAALRLKKWVIPCLVGGAKMPAKAELPPDLTALPGLNGVALSQNGMRRDVGVLLESLKKWRRGA
jgi:hypothetical protein